MIQKGYFIEPTLVVVTDPRHKLMQEEIFGPVLTIFIYPENEYRETLELCDTTSHYGLTGSIFCLTTEKQSLKLTPPSAMQQATSTSMTSQPELLSASNPLAEREAQEQMIKRALI